jgi:hypothetical protein
VKKKKKDTLCEKGNEKEQMKFISSSLRSRSFLLLSLHNLIPFFPFLVEKKKYFYISNEK